MDGRKALLFFPSAAPDKAINVTEIFSLQTATWLREAPMATSSTPGPKAKAQTAHIARQPLSVSQSCILEGDVGVVDPQP